MIIIAEETEKTLIRTLDINETHNNEQRCVHLKTQALQDFDLTKIVEFIHDNVDDQSGSIFICEDGDVFIIARGIGAPFVKNLENNFFSTPTPQPAQKFGLAALFEVRVDRLKLIKIIEAKLKTIKDRENKKSQEQQKQNTEKNRQAVLNQSIAPNLIESLPQRRKEREGASVLIVEDDLFSQKLITNALPDTFSISLAEDGQNALTQYFVKAPDILFLDIGLPDIDGHDVLAKILEHDPHAFIVMLSGKGDKDNITKAMKNGAKGFVGKPFTREKLFQYIEKSPHIQTL